MPLSFCQPQLEQAEQHSSRVPARRRGLTRTPCPEEPGPVCRLPTEERNPLPSRPPASHPLRPSKRQAALGHRRYQAPLVSPPPGFSATEGRRNGDRQEACPRSGLPAPSPRGRRGTGRSGSRRPGDARGGSGWVPRRTWG